MAQLNGLPVYEIKINQSLDSNQGIDFISLVDYPAIEANWVAMADTKKPLAFKFDADLQKLSGPILIPDLPIYRFDPQLGEYYVIFKKDTIENLVRKFQSQQKTINLNYQHIKDSQIPSAVIQEVWLTGKVDKSQSLGFDLPEGSAFVTAYIGDSKFWNEEIKSGNVRGFSIEGFLDMEMKKIKSMEKFFKATTKDGLVIESDAETIATGADVYTMENDQKKPLADGEYTLENGTIIECSAGKITAVTDPNMTEEQMAIIQKALAPVLEKYETRIKELETKLSTMEGKAPEVPAVPAAKPNKIDEVVEKLQSLRKSITKTK